MATTRELRAALRMASYDVDSFKDEYETYKHTMLSPEEAYCLKLFTQLFYKGNGSIVELGAYLGGTTCVFGQALRRIGARKPTLETFDYFQHNGTSRAKLADEPLADDKGFFRVWESNTDAFRDLIRVYPGDLREQALTRQGPIEFLFVDVVKNEALINPVMELFVNDLLVGDGILFHQDYFHWQSPWVVYATEKVLDYLEYIGSVANHMALFRKKHEIPRKLQNLDFVAGLSWEEKLGLMDSAISRHAGLRAGLLEVSKLNLALDCEGFDYEGEAARVRAEYAANARVIRYLDALEANVSSYRESGRDMW